ncbi:MAG: hypothetical protein JOZ27_09215, partial [Caulobacteraceae bacterium]|nr:hypothetical protein [Caulobacteraceae bacterium]
PWRVVNVGRGEPVSLYAFIGEVERAVGRSATIRRLPRQPGDVETTWADTSLLHALTGFSPATSLREGVAAFCDWRRTWRDD